MSIDASTTFTAMHGDIMPQIVGGRRGPNTHGCHPGELLATVRGIGPDSTGCRGALHVGIESCDVAKEAPAEQRPSKPATDQTAVTEFV